MKSNLVNWVQNRLGNGEERGRQRKDPRAVGVGLDQKDEKESSMFGS